MKKSILVILTIILFIHSCTKNETNSGNAGTFEATGLSFVQNGTLPKLYTCDSLGISPGVSWKNPPAGTVSFMITMHTIPPVGEKHVYFTLYDIPSTQNKIPDAVSGIGKFGMNSLNSQNNYSPPCSQGPGAKTYIITVYALSYRPSFSPNETRITMDMLLAQASGKILASFPIQVTYTR